VRPAAASARGDRLTAGRRGRGIVVGVVAAAAAALLIWASDKITLQGERTIYAVRCEPDVWDGTRCTGRLVPAERYAFRASALRQEVIYWIRGSPEPSGKHSQCKVVDRDNWTCTVKPGEKASIANEMRKGRPTRVYDGQATPFYHVPKWKWWLMHFGVNVFSDVLD
jgi:hypothetical protein